MRLLPLMLMVVVTVGIISEGDGSNSKDENDDEDEDVSIVGRVPKTQVASMQIQSGLQLIVSILLLRKNHEEIRVPICRCFYGSRKEQEKSSISTFHAVFKIPVAGGGGGGTTVRACPHRMQDFSLCSTSTVTNEYTIA